jgi:CHAT domain-containing protein
VRGYSPNLLSGLAFAGANRPAEPGKDDGILTAEEIAFLPLNGTELATLSACETGLGEVAGGEGLLGVQRAFQVAGVRASVASLWKVDDIVTRRLMERFYENLWRKRMNKLDALREAQLWLLNDPELVRGLERAASEVSAQPRRSPPFFWAAFQLSGDWR